MKKENLLNEAELRNLIRRRILKNDLLVLNEAAASTGLAGHIMSLSSISPPSGGGSAIMSQANINIIQGAASALNALIASPWLSSTAISVFLTGVTGSTLAGMAGAAAIMTQLTSLQTWLNGQLVTAVNQSNTQSANNVHYALRQPDYNKITIETNTKILAGSLQIPGIKSNSNNETEFLTDASGNIVEGFLGIPSADFNFVTESDEAKTAAQELNLFLLNKPRASSNSDKANEVANKVRSALGGDLLSLSDYDYINAEVYSFAKKHTSLVGPFDGESGARNHYVKRSYFETECDTSRKDKSAVRYLFSTFTDGDYFDMNNEKLFLNAGQFDSHSTIAALLGTINSKAEKKAFKLKNDVAGYDLAKASAAIYDPGNIYHIEEGNYLFFGPDFFEIAAKGVIKQKMSELGDKLLDLAKAAGDSIILLYPNMLKDGEGEIQEQLNELSKVLRDPNSGAIECTVSVLKTLLIIAKVAAEKSVEKIIDFGEDIVDFFTGEGDNETTTTTTTSGSTTSASSKSVTTGTRANTERIQKLLNQYWAREGLTSPDVALEEDGKWGDLTDYMWFAVLEHASDSNSWYKTTTTSAGKDNAGWPATAASLRESDNETFDGKTTGCIQFLEKLLGEDSGAGTRKVNTTPEPDDTLGTTTQQQSREEATGMQGLIKVVETGMNDVMYLEDIGYSEGTSETLARDIINAADRGYTGSGEPLNFVIEIFRKSDSNDYRKVKISRSKGESRRDLRGVEKITNVIKNFFEKKKPDLENDNFQNTIRKSRRTVDIHEFSLSITVPG